MPGYEVDEHELRAGNEYLLQHRPAWSYLPVLSRMWTSGFAVGYSAAVIYRERAACHTGGTQ